VFEPVLWRAIVESRGYRPYPQCALSKDCYCASDAHCPRGMACAPSKAHPSLRACKPNFDEFEASLKDMAGWRGMWARWKATGNPVTPAERAAAQAVLGGGGGPPKTLRRRRARRAA
jgi:hypothetical protein